MSITIGVVPRERFALFDECLERLFAKTPAPFELIVVDCGMPEVYRKRVDKVLEGRPDVKVIRTDRYLLANEAHNLVIKNAGGEWVCLMENDVLVDDHWLDRLINACKAHSAHVATPLIYEGCAEHAPAHLDDRIGTLEAVETPEGRKLRVLSRDRPKEADPGSEARLTTFVEQHCLLLHRSVFERIGFLDESLNTRGDVDLSVSLDQAGVRVVFEPKSTIRYVSPPPVEGPERDFFFFRWDLERAVASNKRVEEKWGLLNMPESVELVHNRNFMGRIEEIRADLDREIPRGAKVALVDAHKWADEDLTVGRPTVPFPHRDGVFWGVPADDEAGIEEVEREKKAGVEFLVFPRSAYWWPEYYPGLMKYLVSHHACPIQDERITVYDLRETKPGPASAAEEAERDV